MVEKLKHPDRTPVFTSVSPDFTFIEPGSIVFWDGSNDQYHASQGFITATQLQSMQNSLYNQLHSNVRMSQSVPFVTTSSITTQETPKKVTWWSKVKRIFGDNE